jgi:hypothetical protein
MRLLEHLHLAVAVALYAQEPRREGRQRLTQRLRTGGQQLVRLAASRRCARAGEVPREPPLPKLCRDQFDRQNSHRRCGLRTATHDHAGQTELGDHGTTGRFGRSVEVVEIQPTRRLVQREAASRFRRCPLVRQAKLPSCHARGQRLAAYGGG